MSLKYVECLRDSWQGLNKFIPTEKKVSYIQSLIDSRFKYLDMGSFVSPKAVPQLSDTEDVLMQLESKGDTDLLCIVANERGLDRAREAKNITSIGYPLSVNDTFQKRNTNRSLSDSWELVKAMQQDKGTLDLVIYLSMGFGNPYGDAWRAKDTADAVAKLRDLGIAKIALADTIGNANPNLINELLQTIEQPDLLGLHLHARPDDWQEKLECAIDFGITWFEGAFGGIGGCPFADDQLVGNLPSEQVLPFLQKKLGLKPENYSDLSQHAVGLASSFS